MTEHTKSLPEPIDLTNEDLDKSDDEDFIIRPKGKPKKFENLSDFDIDEKRKVANIQERKRMKKLSKALEDLRKCIPAEYHITNRKMSKIRTLRLAANYINALTDLLEKDNILKQQTYHMEGPMMHSHNMYLVPSPVVGSGHFGQPGEMSSVHQSHFSPYHTPHGNDNRLSKRHLNFSPFCGTSSPQMNQYQTPVKSEKISFMIPGMVSRHRTSTVSSPFVSGMRNMNEFNNSFMSPTSDSDVACVPESKQYTYTLDGVSPISREENFHKRVTDCVFDPRRLQSATSSKE